MGSFDITTCASTPELPTGAAFNGLEYVGTTLYGYGVPGSCTDAVLHTINPTTGVTVPIGPAGLGVPVSGLAFDGTTMYGVTGCGNFGPSDLVSVNLSTGAATVIGNTGVRLGSCEFGPDGNLYGGGDTTDGGNIYRINLATGAVFLVGPSGLSQVTGLTLALPGAAAVAAPLANAELTGFRLQPARPNPFSGSTTILFDLPQGVDLGLRVYDVSGRAVRTLLDGRGKTGLNSVHWDGRDDDGNRIAAGVYFYRLTSGQFDATRKIIIAH